MHELSIIIEVAKQVERLAVENEITIIDTLVLQIGALSPVIPKYVEAVYPAAVDGTMLEHTKLKIEMLPANGRCRDCGRIYDLVLQQGVCPDCDSSSREMLSGDEFMIKEIVCF
ncbi:MAG: hydrogenase maturation nickel metallochaperone HypA [Lachnospiraceae bacterium]